MDEVGKELVLKEKLLGSKEMTQWVKNLLCKCKDMSSNPLSPYIKAGWSSVCLQPHQSCGEVTNLLRLLGQLTRRAGQLATKEVLSQTWWKVRTGIWDCPLSPTGAHTLAHVHTTRDCTHTKERLLWGRHANRSDPELKVHWCCSSSGSWLQALEELESLRWRHKLCPLPPAAFQNWWKSDGFH